jgi:flavin reductase ActVB
MAEQDDEPEHQSGHPRAGGDSEPAASVLFRDAMSALASGVAVVTARRADGRPAGLLATSVAAYSAAPPSILVSVSHSSRSHAVLVDHAERFGVHLLGRDQEETARVFASRADDKYAALEWEWDDDVPRLAGGVSYLHCRRSAVFDRYDHSVLIGDVLGGEHAGGEPLLWVRRRMDWRLSPEG